MKLIGVREAEKITEKSRQYIYKLMKDKKIKSYVDKGQKKVDLIELLEFIERNGNKERWDRYHEEQKQHLKETTNA